MSISLIDKKIWQIVCSKYCLSGPIIFYHLRNEFDFWNIYGIMNTSGLLHSNWSPLQDTQSIHDSMNIPKLNLLLIFTFYYKYLKYRNYFDLGNKTVLDLICHCINGLDGGLNGKAEQPMWTQTANGANKRLVLHGQMSLAAVNKMYVIHEAMNGYKNLKNH